MKNEKKTKLGLGEQLLSTDSLHSVHISRARCSHQGLRCEGSVHLNIIYLICEGSSKAIRPNRCYLSLSWPTRLNPEISIFDTMLSISHGNDGQGESDGQQKTPDHVSLSLPQFTSACVFPRTVDII